MPPSTDPNSANPVTSSLAAPIWQARQAGAAQLSLALIDSRNRSLAIFGELEPLLDQAASDAARGLGLSPLPWLLGHLAWYQEHWIARNMQRARGAQCDAGQARLPSMLPDADNCFNPALASPAQRWDLVLPDPAGIRGYLLGTLEATLDLLDKAEEDDAALYFFRAALQHEDRMAERMCVMAQSLGWPLALPAPAAVASREPLLVPASAWAMGWTEGGFAFPVELPVHEVRIPSFEIDAQPVQWAQYIEFVDDGGYDREELWSPQGWAWLQREAQGQGRRGPRHVDQISVASGAVMATRFGRPSRMSGSQPVVHASWWEADAWCRWAGRRLPTEVEWEAAAVSAARRGFVWGEVHEWTASTLRAYPGGPIGPDLDGARSALGQARAVRGASFATHARQRHARARGWLAPQCDEAFVGFRSCAG